MAGLVRLEEPFHLGYRLGRTHANRLVQDQPAGNRPALLLATPGHLVLFVVFVPEIACYLRRVQQPVYLLEIVIAGIEPETEFRHVLHLPERGRHAAPYEAGMPVQRIDHSRTV